MQTYQQPHSFFQHLQVQMKIAQAAEFHCL